MDQEDRSLMRVVSFITQPRLAEEAFFCGTGIQIAAITRVDHRPIGAGRIGRTVSDLRKLYFEVVRGRHSEYRCVPAYSGQSDFTQPEPERTEPASEQPRLVRLVPRGA